MPNLYPYKRGLRIFYQKLPFILILIIVSLISIIASLITDLTQKFIYLIIILIFAAIAVSFIYIKEIIRNLTLNEYIANDIVILDYTKVITIDDTSSEKGCKIKEIREVRNNMTITYNYFLFETATEQTAPPFDNFQFFRDGKKIILDDKNTQFVLFDDQDLADDPSKKNNVFQFKFPIHMRPKKIHQACFEYRTKAYSEALNSKLDYVQVTINSITERLCLKILLKGEISKNRKLIEPTETYDDGSQYLIEVKDKSGQRMWTSDNYILDNFRPRFRDNLVEWKIYRPKVGYSYKLYFMLTDKE